MTEAGPANETAVPGPRAARFFLGQVMLCRNGAVTPSLGRQLPLRKMRSAAGLPSAAHTLNWGREVEEGESERGIRAGQQKHSTDNKNAHLPSQPVLQ